MKLIALFLFLTSCSLFREEDEIIFKGKATEELLGELNHDGKK